MKPILFISLLISGCGAVHFQAINNNCTVSKTSAAVIIHCPDGSTAVIPVISPSPTPKPEHSDEDDNDFA